MTVAELVKSLRLTVLTMDDPTRQVTGGYVGDLLSWVMGRSEAGNAWITIMSNANILAVASLTDCACVILAEGVQPDAGVAELAKQKGVTLLSSQESAFCLCGRLASVL